MTNSELELWNKIREFQFDKPGVKLTFAKRLARENSISRQFADEIIDEYRKFIFLCCVSENEVSPSHFVDLAWHLHLTYTRSYWIELCRNTIGRDLHHNPSEGGREEDAKFSNLYKDTLDLYEQYFGSVAPEAIWPGENSKPPQSHVELEKSRFWVIPKPAFGFRGRKNSITILALVLSTLLVGCTGSFPMVLILLLLIGVVFLLVWRNNKRTGGDGSSGCGSSGCGSISGSDDNGDAGDSGGGDSGCSSGCSGGCGGGGD